MADKMNTQKTRGAWIIHVERTDDGKGTGVGTPNGSTPHYSEQQNMKGKKEE